MLLGESQAAHMLDISFICAEESERKRTTQGQEKQPGWWGSHSHKTASLQCQTSRWRPDGESFKPLLFETHWGHDPFLQRVAG